MAGWFSKSKDGEDDVLKVLPSCFYAFAFLFAVGMIFAIFSINDKGGDTEQVGYMMGCTVGGVLSILATGRLIELVRRISDDVRAIRERTDSQK